MELLNAIVVLANYVFVPAIAYGSQLALGALGVTLVYGILRFSNFDIIFLPISSIISQVEPNLLIGVFNVSLV